MPRLLYRYADEVVCVSQHVSCDVQNLYKVPLSKIRVIYNPIDVQSNLNFAKEDVNLPWFNENIPIIAGMGSLVPAKGYSFLLRALKLVLAKCPVRLLILGQGNQEAALKVLAEELDINEQVTFLGFQTNPFKYLSRSTLFVHPSLSEAFPMVILEAMGCGLPVISTAYPGSDEIITNGVNGILVTLADENTLADAIIKLLSNKTYAANLAQEAKNRINNYSIENVIKEYEVMFSADA